MEQQRLQQPFHGRARIRARGCRDDQHREDQQHPHDRIVTRYCPAMMLRLLIAVGLVLLPTLAHADDLADAKAFISKQVDQIKKGDVDGLKAGFTARLQDKITKDMAWGDIPTCRQTAQSR